MQYKYHNKFDCYKNHQNMIRWLTKNVITLRRQAKDKGTVLSSLKTKGRFYRLLLIFSIRPLLIPVNLFICLIDNPCFINFLYIHRVFRLLILEIQLNWHIPKFFNNFLCVVVTFVPENGTNVEITRRSPIQILPLQPNKNGNFDTKLPFIFYAENAYMQGFSEIRKVSLWFFIRYFPVKMLLFA